MLVHADHDERRPRTGAGERRQLAHAVAAEDRLVDDDDRRGDAIEQPPQAGRVGGRRQRLGARVRVEELPQRGPHPLVPGGDEDGDGRSRGG